MRSHPGVPEGQGDRLLHRLLGALEGARPLRRRRLGHRSLHRPLRHHEEQQGGGRDDLGPGPGQPGEGDRPGEQDDAEEEARPEGGRGRPGEAHHDGEGEQRPGGEAQRPARRRPARAHQELPRP